MWLLAHRQTAARGRMGRKWVASEGNFFASVLLRPGYGPAEAALRSFVAALALREALVAVSGREDAFSLKWPNDVLLRGQKLAGILLESDGGAEGLRHLVVGIGVNLAHAPARSEVEQQAVPPTSLKSSLGVEITPERFLDALVPAFDRWDRKLTDDGFAPIRTAWLSHAARLGEVITARLPHSEITGTFETLDAHGALVLKAPDGRHVLPAAEIFFP